MASAYQFLVCQPIKQSLLEFHSPLDLQSSVSEVQDPLT